MSATIRIAHKEDLPALFKVDYATNITHPFYVIPWKATAPGTREACILDRYTYFYDCPNPKGTFLVAVAGDEIVGFLVYRYPTVGEPVEWNPDFPDGMNVRFYEKVVGEIEAAKKQYDLKDCWRTYRY